MQLPITNVIDISVSAAQQGIGAYNTSNLAIFTDEQPADSFGDDGFSIYLAPTQVGVDFGSASKTFAMANAVFSQQPNILAGNGYLVVIPLTVAIQDLVLSAAPTSGTFILNYGGHATVPINWNDTASIIQTKLQALAGLEQVVVSGSISSENLVVNFYGAYGAQALLTVTSNTLNASITVTVSTATAGETLAAAITRTAGLVQYFGIIADQTTTVISSADVLAAAAVIQPLNKIGFFASYASADIETGGLLDELTTGGFSQSRGLYYGDNSTSKELDTVVFMASYAGRALSTNFSGSNTTSTMHLKDLIGVQPDPTMTQTLLNKAIAAGADSYPSLQGVPKVFCSGANSFYDQVYNLLWFVGGLQVAGFNFLAESATKIPQTENGMDGLKGAYRGVCEQGITNQYGAPGTWNSSTTFGNQVDFIQNIAQRGYYIFSQPIALQSQVDRVARKAPLVQIAFKEAGAIQSSTVIVNVNA